MVEIGSQGDALAHHIVCREVDAKGARAAGGLRGVGVDFADEGGVVGQREVEVEGEVVAHALLLALELEHRIEVGNLVAGAHHKGARDALHQLAHRHVEREGAAVAVLGVEGDVVLHCGVEANEGRELLGDAHRRDVVGRRRDGAAREGVLRVAKALAYGHPVAVGRERAH